jgi:hypothetical protein
MRTKRQMAGMKSKGRPGSRAPWGSGRLPLIYISAAQRDVATRFEGHPEWLPSVSVSYVLPGQCQVTEKTKYFGAPGMNMMGTQIIGKFPCS